MLKDSLQSNDYIAHHIQQYESFFNSVMKGELGPTAQYWCMYVYMINRIHRDLMRAVGTNDVVAYISVLPAVLDVIFGLNRPNYASWGVLFLEHLEKMSPECRHLLETGAFSIRRTDKQYSRTAVDLALEETVNRDAASPMRGIVHFIIRMMLFEDGASRLRNKE